MRSPVNEPGPVTTLISPTSSSLIRAWPSSSSTAGINRSEWVVRILSMDSPTSSSSLSSAAPPVMVDVSMPRMYTETPPYLLCNFPAAVPAAAESKFPALGPRFFQDNVQTLLGQLLAEQISPFHD